MSVLIVIVNYRTADLTVDCLRSLAPQMSALPAGTRVVVTDNASGDDSVPRLTDAVRDNNWGDWASVMPLPRNGGFAYANNEGIRPALESNNPPRYVLLLNPDTVVRPGAVNALLDFMESRPDVGITGSRLEDPDGTGQRSAFRFHTISGEFENALRLGVVTKLLSKRVVAPEIPTDAGPTDWAAGASMMIRREVFDAIGLLDEKYFMYFEEGDFCLRAKRAGWPTWYVPASRVVHLVGQASQWNDKKQAAAPKRRPPYWFESRRRFFVKNHGRAYALLADAAYTVGFTVWRLRRFVQRKPDTDPPKFLLDFVRYSTLAQGFKV
jgi:N-acetylglucosaminyl-diphospho-decaprenol L-rhamnosyltransferase